MMDREKVIKEFADFVKSFAKRDDTYYKGLFVSVLDLLKEQEPLAPGWSNGKAFCGQCGEPFPRHRGKIRRFCTYCGRQVKWK